MTIIFISKTSFQTLQYDNATGLLYDPETEIYTVQYGEEESNTFAKADWLVAIMFK